MSDHQVERWIRGVVASRRSPLTWILAGVLVLHAVGLGWGLPGPDGWDDDGVAPRDFLVGVVQTYQSGQFFRYPPLHLLILSGLTAPIWIVGLLHATSLTPDALVHEFIHPPYMTMFAIVARLVTLVMSLGVVYLMAKLGEEVYNRRTGLCIAAVVGLCAPFTYYGGTSNLDVPYLFWSFYALLELARAMVRREPGRLRKVGVLTAMAIATKDQASTLLLLSIPTGLAGWFVLDRWARSQARSLLKQLAWAALLGLLILAVVDGALVNPQGFAARVNFLFGSASQDHAPYAHSLRGSLSVLSDSFFSFGSFYPWPFALFILHGFSLHVLRREPANRFVAGLLPLLAALIFTLTFNCVARRTEHRFLLPQMLLLAFYAGISLDAILFAADRRAKIVGRVLVAQVMAWALFNCLAVDVNLLQDPRYDAEAWLFTHVRPGDVVEVYGNQVYWPRLPPQARIVRVDDTAVEQRSALLGVTELQARYQDVEQRRPRWIVLSEVFASRYRWADPGGADSLPPAPGERVMTKWQERYYRDAGAREYFQRLRREQCGYRVAHVSEWASRFWPRVQIHASTGNEIWIFERVAAP